MDDRISKIWEYGSPCFVIAEIGLNHNGDFELACKSVEAAAQAGVDAVKFQNFETEDFLTDRSYLYTYKSQGKEIKEPLFDICKRSEFKREWFPDLSRLCDKLGVVFISTPTSEKGVDDLIEFHIPMLKNGSDYLTHIPLIEYMGKTGKPLILSTGMAYEDDIIEAVKALKRVGNDYGILLHCVSSYPTKDENVNLRRMVSIGKKFNIPVGYSDHTIGWKSSVQAVSMGAKVIEKHFSLSNQLPGPDHWFSASPKEMETLVSEVRSAETRLGSDVISPAICEIEVRQEYRLSIVSSRNIEEGSILTRQDLAFKKPGQGILPKDLDQVVGATLIKSVKIGEPILYEFIIRN